MEALITACIIIVLAVVYYLFFSPEFQLFGYFPYHIKTCEKIIALTFDDGPNPGSTDKLLSILAKHNIMASFFVVGKNVENNPTLTKAIVVAGHIVGNHSYNHNFIDYLTDLSFKSEISKTQATLERITGKSPTFFRPPWLFRHPRLFRSLKENNLTPVSGTFGSELEVFQPHAKRLVSRAMSKVKPGAILIFHDGYNSKGGNRSHTVEAINILIPKILGLGYKFVTVETLLNIPIP